MTFHNQINTYTMCSLNIIQNQHRHCYICYFNHRIIKSLMNCKLNLIPLMCFRTYTRCEGVQTYNKCVAQTKKKKELQQLKKKKKKIIKTLKFSVLANYRKLRCYVYKCLHSTCMDVFCETIIENIIFVGAISQEI